MGQTSWRRPRQPETHGDQWRRADLRQGTTGLSLCSLPWLSLYRFFVTTQVGLLQFAMPLAQQVSRLDDVGSDTLSRLTSRITPFLFLLYIVAYIDRINVSFAAPQMHQQLGFSDGVYGLGAGIFFAGYLLFQLPSTLVLERVGARRGIAAMLIAW